MGISSLHRSLLGSTLITLAAVFAPAHAADRLVNLSTNGYVGEFGLRAGFIVRGDRAKRIVVLGERFESPVDAVLKVTDLTGEVAYGSNDNWRDDVSADEVQSTIGRAPGNDLDAAFALTLTPGVYIAWLESGNGQFGNGIVAINDFSDDASLTRLINISTNGHVGEFGLRAGFIIEGNQPMRVIVLGERFASEIDALLTVTDLTSDMVYGQNDNWRDDPTADEIVATVRRTPGVESDAAIALTLDPGVYIAWLESVNGKHGNGIVSVNDFPLTDPLRPDLDDDGLSDEEEAISGTNPLDLDSDDDDLPDGAEIDIGTDALDPDTDDDGVLDGADPFPTDATQCGDGNVCAGDPTFIQVPKGRWQTLNGSQVDAATTPIIARIEVPVTGALVRGDIPVFGVAGGKEFKSYRVQIGRGTDPEHWTTIAQSDTPVDAGEWQLEDSADASLRGNLATWDTGLRNYVYLPSHPAERAVDLKGTHVIRLLVTGKNELISEDRVTVDVANVIPNAWGGWAVSEDGLASITVAEQSTMDSFRLIGIQPVTSLPASAPSGQTLVGKVYAFREPGDRFTKPATIALTLPEHSRGPEVGDQTGIYAYDEPTGQWTYLRSALDNSGTTVTAIVRKLHPFYALMSGPTPARFPHETKPTNGTRAKWRVTDDGQPRRYLIENAFETDLGQWSNRDGEVGGEVSLDSSVTYDGTRALKVTNTRAGGNFSVNVMETPFDVREYPVVRFDYRISPGVRTNFLVNVAGRWYDIGFTDDPKTLEDRRVNIAGIGAIEGVVADDQWHTASFNLYELLRRKTGNTIVESMVMADWDVPGYMKLAFGGNPANASYYIDNFTVARDPSAGYYPVKVRLRIDDFNQKMATNSFGGSTGIFDDGEAERLIVDFAVDDARGHGHSLVLTYDVSNSDSFAGYTTALEGLDLRDYHALSFAIKGIDAEEDIIIGLKDRNATEEKRSLRPYLGAGDVTAWRYVNLPLTIFRSELDLRDIDELGFSFAHGRSSAGKVLIDDVEFLREPDSVLVQDFERLGDTNLLGGTDRTFARGAAAINGQRVRTPAGAVYAISYGGNIGDAFGFDSGLNYAGWVTGLGGTDCAPCDTVSFRIRGAEGGEQPNIYLGDGNFRWGVELSKFVDLTTEWQSVTLPLDHFAEYGVDLTHLEQFEIVFEWKRMSGTVFVDDIRLGPLSRQLTHR